MRDFRGFSKEKGWVFGYYYFKDGKHFILENSNEVEVDGNSIGEFTSLTDDKEQKIYEGDIVRYTDLEDGVGIIRFENGEFVIETADKKVSLKQVEDLRVIGDVYTNPTLFDNLIETLNGDDEGEDGEEFDIGCLTKLEEMAKKGAKIKIKINDEMEDIQINIPYDELFLITKALEIMKLKLLDDIKNDEYGNFLVEYQHNVFDNQEKDNIYDILKQIDGMIVSIKGSISEVHPY